MAQMDGGMANTYPTDRGGAATGGTRAHVQAAAGLVEELVVEEEVGLTAGGGGGGGGHGSPRFYFEEDGRSISAMGSPKETQTPRDP